MSPVRHGIIRWPLRILPGLAVVGVLYCGALFYPSPLFGYHQRIGRYQVYSDRPIPAEMSTTVVDIDRRVAAMEHDRRGGTHRIFLCHDQRRYALFAFLTRKSAESIAIGLSLPDESFVSMTRLRRLAQANRDRLRHTRFEGNLAEVVAHEIAHFHSLRALGWRAHLRQPPWKSEGWAEYQANLAAIRADPDYDLRQRIDRLFDDASWSGDARASRWLWESQLLVEFLGQVPGYRLADLSRDEVTEATAREAMLAWYRAPESPRNDLPTPIDAR